MPDRDRVAVRVLGRVPHEAVDRVQHAIADVVFELLGVVVHVAPVQFQHAHEEATYEGYGPGGAALYIECVTDNTNRTVAELRHLIDKAGGNLGTAGSVAWMFERKGQIAVDASRYDEESLLEAALAAGAEDLESDEEEHVISTSVQDFNTVQDALEERVG